MHDPEVLAFSINKPWPKVHVINGRKFRHRPSLVDVWHVDPKGGDCFDTCSRSSHWRWHVHHWHISWCFIRRLQRRWLTRCEWCGRGAPKIPGTKYRDWPSTSIANHTGFVARHTTRFGEKRLVHSDCCSVWSAHQACMCDTPFLDHVDYGRCFLCGGVRSFGQVPNDAQRMLRTLKPGAPMPREWKPELKQLWDEARNA